MHHPVGEGQGLLSRMRRESVVVPSQAARAVKGILNKLTPENFERLLQQVLETVADADVLHATMTLVFENAVAQPTFAFMYAQLCDHLSKARRPGPLASDSPSVQRPDIYLHDGNVACIPCAQVCVHAVGGRCRWLGGPCKLGWREQEP